LVLWNLLTLNASTTYDVDWRLSLQLLTGVIDEIIMLGIVDNLLSTWYTTYFQNLVIVFTIKRTHVIYEFRSLYHMTIMLLVVHLSLVIEVRWIQETNLVCYWGELSVAWLLNILIRLNFSDILKLWDLLLILHFSVVHSQSILVCWSV